MTFIHKWKAFFSNRKNSGKVIYWSLVGLIGGVFVLSGIKIIDHFYQAEKSAHQFEELVQLPQEVAPEEEDSAAKRYAPLVEKNSDFFGWLKIEGTNIDYPVVCSPGDPEYYLRRDFNKDYSYYGVPFTEEEAKPDSMNITVYGHNMNNGTMFSALENYRSYQFYEKHSRIRFDTLEELGEYRIVAVFCTQAGYPDEFEYFKFIDGTKEEFDAYVAKCKSLSLYEIKITPEYGDQLLTLSTCEYTKENGRLVVVAQKIKENIK